MSPKDPARFERARRLVKAFVQAHPHVARALPARGFMRGIDAYRPEKLVVFVANAIDDFRARNGRDPDLVALPETRDHFFLMKFFAPIPLPSPADKLGLSAYLTAEAAARAFVPARPWVSEEPRLPPDDAVPPGRYYAKLALGYENNLPLAWPPSPGERGRIDAVLEDWFRRPRFGVIVGEWWYALGKQRVFLEEDLSERMAGRPEAKIYVREGKPVMGYLIAHDFKTRVHGQRYFDAQLRPLDGLTRGYRRVEDPLPESIGEMMALAAAAGEKFRLVRVDFLDVGGPRPCLGELTLCDQNAGRCYVPPEFDRVAKRLLFD